MYIAVLGVNHKTACVDVREQVALNDDGCQDLARTLVDHPGVGEAVVVSTCNRTEVYVSGPQLPLREVALDGLCAVSSACREDLHESIYYLEDREAVKHLFSVASSLDSMVLGEAQILHQLKSAYQVAEDAGATGVILNKLLRRSFEVGKRVRTETKIGESSVSVASVSVDLARSVFGDLAGRAVLVIGAGEMAELVVTHLRAHGVHRFRVANRTFERAVELAERFGGDAVRYEALEEHLAGVDIVISSTAAAPSDHHARRPGAGDAEAQEPAHLPHRHSRAARHGPGDQQGIQRLPLRHRRPAGGGRRPTWATVSARRRWRGRSSKKR